MVIQINSKGNKATKAMMEAAEVKLQFAEKFLGDGTVKISVANVKKSLDVSLICVYNGKMVKIEKSGDDFYCILDELGDSLKNKLEKIHSKSLKKNKKHEDIMRDVTYIEETMIQGAHVTKRKKAEMVEMTEAEAIDKMEDLGHETFVFKNKETGTICMIYSRFDADYGLLELE